MANVVYNSAKVDLLKANIDYESDTIMCAMVTSSYSPNVDTHAFYDDISNEISGTGYTTGGAEITSKTVTQDDTDNEGVFDGANITWASSTLIARGAVIYKDTGTASTSPLICYVDFGADKSSSAGDFIIQWNSEGILNIS